MLRDRPTLGFLLASLNTGASRALWPGLLDAAARLDINLVSFPGGRLRSSTAFESQRNQIFDLASTECLDGLVTWASSLGGVLSPGEISAFHQRYEGLPMVSLAQFMEGLPAVALDSYQGMRALLTHLIKEHGFTRLAFIRGPEEHYYAQERYRAYLDTLQAHDLPLIPELVTRPLRWESGAEAVQILLDERGLKPGVDFQAVVAVSDMLALWALKTLQARGYDIPGDVAVTGFNNSIEERLSTPPLTTVDLPFYDQGAKSVELLLAQLNGETVPALMTLPSSLVVRESCGCASAAVAQASFQPQEKARDTESIPVRLRETPEREKCLTEMAQAAGGTLPDGLRVGLNILLDELISSLENFPAFTKKKNRFLQILDDLLNQAMRTHLDVLTWNDVLSVLRRWALPGLNADARAALEALLSQARVVVSEAERRAQAYWQWQAERQTENLRETNRALLTTFDVRQLGDVLYEHLPGLGIPSAYLVLYDASGFSRLMMAYTEQGRAALDPAGWRFATRQLLPPEFLPHERRYSLVVEPLYFQEKSLGYAVFEIGPREGNIYELLRANLSSAIQGALLFDEIQQARLTAEKADRIKTRLLANVSHELRTPLNIILGTTQTLLAPQQLEPSLHNDIQNIQDHAEHQLRVINDLLDLSRAEIDELDLSLELIDPRPLLEDAFHAIAGNSANPNVEWRLDLPARLPLIRADAVRLRQILLNLLSNARKFTEKGQVMLGAEVAPPHVHLWVSDTGWGIPPEQQERIFEPFVTMEHDRRIAGGIGLGLSITRHLVALHGGRMTLDSQAGRGSIFHIQLPLPALERDQASGSDAQPVLLLLASSGLPAAEIQAMSLRQNLKICLVSNMDELEAALANTKPLAVAWDLSSARPGDWNLVRRLRSHTTLSLAPVIIYGQLPESDSPSLGLTGFVAKTPNPQTLLETLNALCPADSAGSILIVDDDPEVRAAHKKLVEQGLPGCVVQLAKNGENALSLMESQVPSLVLLDLVMPGLGGADVLDRMRADPRLRSVPVVVLSSKLLSLEDVKRLEHHARVTLQSKGIWSETETISALNRALFGVDTLPPQTSALVKRAVAYLHQNYTRPLSRWEIAEAIGVSEDYLTRVFNRELEISPWDYLNRYRVLQAQALLRNTARSIADIARAVGFKDQAYFSRVFSKQMGISPNEYRNNG
ncbi:MAG: substrate-binding domain-containing protein [Anaerolineae bacterium]|nr:substrate-binding domain-containing protein [Anaerolineae bacterium]